MFIFDGGQSLFKTHRCPFNKFLKFMNEEQDNMKNMFSLVLAGALWLHICKIMNHLSNSHPIPLLQVPFAHAFNRIVYHRLIHFNIWSLAGHAIWEDCGFLESFLETLEHPHSLCSYSISWQGIQCDQATPIYIVMSCLSALWTIFPLTLHKIKPIFPSAASCQMLCYNNEKRG